MTVTILHYICQFHTIRLSFHMQFPYTNFNRTSVTSTLITTIKSYDCVSFFLVSVKKISLFFKVHCELIGWQNLLTVSDKSWQLTTTWWLRSINILIDPNFNVEWSRRSNDNAGKLWRRHSVRKWVYRYYRASTTNRVC